MSPALTPTPLPSRFEQGYATLESIFGFPPQGLLDTRVDVLPSFGRFAMERELADEFALVVSAERRA